MPLIVEDLFGYFQGDHPFAPVKTAQTCCAAGQVLPETEAWGRVMTQVENVVTHRKRGDGRNKVFSVKFKQMRPKRFGQN